eukprot:CAMPEP_0180525838 /NCGR_PEP_ID=MMETSP1036_2-20121128/59375_1 /TAXON_ID=632150 /ORGANISM="Azadinium spinosum, Strain 3D9" /LENGTH=89 /DNA_ID=CAMNT_0022539151 /DNA_START=23 /DNA_END=289 /DNA_ORIENTATION=+
MAASEGPVHCDVTPQGSEDSGASLTATTVTSCGAGCRKLRGQVAPALGAGGRCTSVAGAAEAATCVTRGATSPFGLGAGSPRGAVGSVA